MRLIRWALVGAVAVIFGALAVFVAGMRAKVPIVIYGVRRLSRATKRLPLRTAGASGSHVSVVRHVGRKTGATFETPVQPARTENGFAIALPYGTSSDWVRNVLTSGSAVIVHDGAYYPVESPQIVPLASVGAAFSARNRLAQRVFDVQDCLRVIDAQSRVSSTKPGAEPARGAPVDASSRSSARTD